MLTYFYTEPLASIVLDTLINTQHSTSLTNSHPFPPS